MPLRCNLFVMLVIAGLTVFCQAAMGQSQFDEQQRFQPPGADEDGAQMPPPRPYRPRAGGDNNEDQPGFGQFPGSLPGGGFRRRGLQRPGNFPDGEQANQEMPEFNSPGNRGQQGFPGNPGFGQGGGGRRGFGPRGGPGQGQAGQRGLGSRGQEQGKSRQMFGGPLDLTALNLSQKQKDKIKQQREVNSGKAREIRQSLRSARMQMRDMMFDPSMSDAQIRSKRQQLKQMQDQLDDLLVNDFLSLRATLTPEQKKRLPELAPGRQQFGGQRQPRRFSRPQFMPQGQPGAEF